MKGYYQLIEGNGGGFMFTLRAGNHETILERKFVPNPACTRLIIIRFGNSPDKMPCNVCASARKTRCAT